VREQRGRFVEDRGLTQAAEATGFEGKKMADEVVVVLVSAVVIGYLIGRRFECEEDECAETE
jgi:hypothetical protein